MDQLLVKEKSINKKWLVLLGVLLVGYVIKNILVGADIDEAYGVTVGYRLVQGDRLLLDMWEPHQTSAIFTALFIRLILIFTGGSLNYLTILLRVCFFVVQTLITVYFYRCLKQCVPTLHKGEVLLLSMAYFITTPKCIFVPEYSNLHVWFSTLLALFLIQFFCKPDKYQWRYLVAAGAMLACDVLAYPSMVLFYPVCVGVLWFQLKSVRKSFKAVCFFTLPCLLGAAVLIGYILSYMSLDEINTVLPYILVDGSHQATVWEKLAIWGAGLGEIALMTLACGIVAGVIAKLWTLRKKEVDFTAAFLVSWFLVQMLMQTSIWFHSEYNSGYPQIAYIMVPIFGLFAYRHSKAKIKIGYYLIGMAMLNYIGLNLFSNWKPISLNVYLILGLVGGFLCYRQYFIEKNETWGLQWIRTLLLVFVISEIFGRCFLMIGGDDGGSMTLNVRGISREGVRGGILTAYMNSYRYNDNYENFAEIVPEGSMIFYVGPSQFYYMLGDCRVGAPSTICTPEYDETLDAYYALHPERFPQLVIVESCYGDVSLAEDDYIFTWLEESFKPTEVVDYPYVRVYKK